MRHIGLVIGVIGLLVLGSIAALPVAENASATTYYYASHELSSYNSSSWKIYPRYASSPVAMYAAQVREDGNVSDLYTTADSTYVQTNDFTNPTWNYPDYPYVGGQVVDTPIPDNGTVTIEKVYVVVQFSLNIPKCYLYFSTNDKASWQQSYLYTASANQRIYWDVTALVAWNATILNSNELWAQMRAYTSSGVHYYLDYLGFSVTWSTEYDIEAEYGLPIGDPPEDPSEADSAYDIIYTAEGIIGIMGMVGFIGMIATPALAIYVYRNNSGEGKMNIFIKMLALFMFCLTFFMVSVSS